MSKKKQAFLALVAVTLFWQTTGADHASGADPSDIDQCLSTAVAAPGVVLVCPNGDGDPLTSTLDGVFAQITLTVIDYLGAPMPGIPAADMWMIGCNDLLLLCGTWGVATADGPTNAAGKTTFSNEPWAGGCDQGIRVVVQGVIIGAGVCGAPCVPIQVRSPDYKSAGGFGPPPCPGDFSCPDWRVTNADFSWFITHFPTASNPGPIYRACADFALPLGSPITLADFARFSVHFVGGHSCVGP